MSWHRTHPIAHGRVNNCQLRLSASGRSAQARRDRACRDECICQHLELLEKPLHLLVVQAKGHFLQHVTMLESVTNHRSENPSRPELLEISPASRARQLRISGLPVARVPSSATSLLPAEPRTPPQGKWSTTILTTT